MVIQKFPGLHEMVIELFIMLWWTDCL